MMVQLSGTHHLAAPPERVWQALADPAALERALPGCRSARRDDGGFVAEVDARVGAVEGGYRVTARVVEADRPRRCDLEVEAVGASGVARGELTIELEADGDGTDLVYRGKADVDGAIAQVGRRLIGSAAGRGADAFLVALDGGSSGAPAAAAAGIGAASAEAPAGPVAAGPDLLGGSVRTVPNLVAVLAGAAIVLVGVVVCRRLLGRRGRT